MLAKKISGKTYIRLMNYMIQKCDMISLQRYYNQNPDQIKEVIDIILSKYSYLMENLIKKYSKCNLYKLYNKLKNDSDIFDSRYMEKYENDYYKKNYSRHEYLRIKKYNRKSVIYDSINWYIYNITTNSWLNKYSASIHSKEIETLEYGSLNILYSDTYYIDLTSDIKEEILSKSDIYDWKYPTCLDNISFFKNGKCYLSTVAHEEICRIYCENKEEYNYFKSIGIDFIDNDKK